MRASRLASRSRALIYAAFVSFVSGCGSRVDEGEDLGIHGAVDVTGSAEPQGGLPCPPFEERVDRRCRSVEVRGLDEESVWFESNGYLLPGTLTLPVTDGDYFAPGAIIVHGTGPGGRDGISTKNLGYAYPEPVPTYENLAHALAREGLAVLRYDKRSCFREQVPGCKNSISDYPGDPESIVLDDFVADARRAAEYVAARPEVRNQDVVALGHSEGGVLVTALLSAESVVGSAVLLSAPSMSFEDTATGQLETYAAHLDELGPEFSSDAQALRDKAETWRDELAAIRAGSYPESSWEGAPLAYVESTFEWYDSLPQRFTATNRSVLVLAGSADYNVWPEHFHGYRQLATDHVMTNVTAHLLPDVTHALCLRPDPDPWAPFDPALAPEAAERLRSWLGGPPPPAHAP